MGAGSPPIGAPGDGILPGLSVKGVSPDTCMSIDYHSIPTFEDVADLLPYGDFHPFTRIWSLQFSYYFDADGRLRSSLTLGFVPGRTKQPGAVLLIRLEDPADLRYPEWSWNAISGLRIDAVNDRQWENVRYLVYDGAEDSGFRAYCSGIRFSRQALPES